MLIRLAACAAICASVFGVASQAQNVFVLPGLNSSSSTVLPFSTQFVPIGSGFTAGAGPFQVFAKQDGTQYYVVSTSSSQTVTTVDPGFQSPQALTGLNSLATAAALTSDGKYLLVVAGGALNIYSTASNTLVTPNAVQPNGGSIIDLAVSLDGTEAFILTSTTNQQGNAQATLYGVDPSTGHILGSAVITNIVTGVTVGPNNLVYVNGVNRLYEFNPATLSETTNGVIGLNANAGKPGFTPDGKYALVPNQLPGQSGFALLLVDLAAHTVKTLSSNLGNAVISQVLVPSNTEAFAYSSVTESVYQVTIPDLTITGASFPGIPTLNVTAAALSGEVAEGTNLAANETGSRVTSQFLYLVIAGTLYRVDLTTNQVSGKYALSLPSAQTVALAGPVNTGSPSALLVYGSNQIIGASGTSLPLVVQALDGNGNPLSGVPVAFATSSSGVTIKNASVTTGANGYAVTTISGPAANGVVTVTATAATQTASFSITVGSGNGGGGGGTSAGTLAINSGQGQIFLAGFGSNTGNGVPIGVLATDADGNPVAGLSVTFEPVVHSGGSGVSLIPGNQTNGTDKGPTPDGFGRIVATDDHGLASVNVQPNAQIQGGLQQVQLLASAKNINSVTFYETVAPSTLSPAVQSTLSAGATITGQSGSTLKAAEKIVVVSEQGIPIPDVSIQAIVPPSNVVTGPNQQQAPLAPSPYVSCADATGNGVLTDLTGTATCDLIIKASPGNYSFSINVGSYIVQGPFNIKVTPGSVSAIAIISGNSQTGAPGQALPVSFVAQVNDASGHALAGQHVSFQVVTGGSITLNNVTSTSDSNGRVSAQGTLGSTPGTYQIQVIAGNGVVGTFSFTISVPAAGLQVVSGDKQSTPESTAFASPLVVKVTGSGGAGVAGVAISFTATNGATLSTTSATSDANGEANTTVTAGAAPGTITVTATASGGFTASFTLTALPPGPSNVTFLNGASFQSGIAPGAIALIRGTGLLPGFQGLFTPSSIIGPLPTSITTGALAGLSVTFAGIAAPIYYASNQNGQEQIAVQVPYEAPPGATSVVINTPGGGSGTVSATLQPVSPGVFQTQYNGQSFAVAIRQSDGSYISPTNPAHINDTICVFATGLGQTTPTLATNSTGVPNATLVDAIDVGLNNAGVHLVSATPLQYEVGVFEVCMVVPTGTATGPRQPVGIVIHTTPGVSSGDFFGNSTYVPIQ